MITHAQIQAMLTARGKTGVSLVDYTLLDRSDGQGAVIGDWNTATLGAVPTQAELDAITPAQITAAQTTERQAQFTATSRRKDVLATCALVVRARGIATWNGMTVQQKKDATLVEADVWSNIRDFIETNL